MHIRFRFMLWESDKVEGEKGNEKREGWWGWKSSAGNKIEVLWPSDRYRAHKQCEKYWVMTSEWWCEIGVVF